MLRLHHPGPRKERMRTPAFRGEPMLTFTFIISEPHGSVWQGYDLINEVETHISGGTAWRRKEGEEA